MTKAAIRILWKELPHIEEGKQPSQDSLDALDQLLKHPEGPEAIKQVVLTAIRAMDIKLAKYNTPSVDVKATDPERYEKRKQESEESAKKHTDFIKAFFSYDRINKSVSLDNLIALIRGEEVDLNPEKQESYNEEVYNTRVSRKHPYLSDEKMQALKSLSSLYSKEGDIHTLGSLSGAIPDHSKSTHQDMKDPDGNIALPNITQNSYIKTFVEQNNLKTDLGSSRELLFGRCQQIADVRDLGITFDLSYANNEDNDKQIEEILYALYTITGQVIDSPFAIEGLIISSLGVTDVNAGMTHEFLNDYCILAPVLPQQK